MDKYFLLITFNNSVAIVSKWSDDGNSNNRPFHLQFHQGINTNVYQWRKLCSKYEY